MEFFLSTLCLHSIRNLTKGRSNLVDLVIHLGFAYNVNEEKDSRSKSFEVDSTTRSTDYFHIYGIYYISKSRIQEVYRFINFRGLFDIDIYTKILSWDSDINYNAHGYIFFHIVIVKSKCQNQ